MPATHLVDDSVLFGDALVLGMRSQGLTSSLALLQFYGFTHNFQYSSNRFVFDRTGARMTFRGFAGLGRNYGDGQARFARQQLLRCRFGFLNCRTLRSSLDDLSDGSVATNILHKVELYKSHMQQYKLYALALSEVRLDFQGSHIYADGFTIIASGVGARGGAALLLSPGATSAWQLAGSRSVGHPSGRVCSCTLALGGKEGTVKLSRFTHPLFGLLMATLTLFGRLFVLRCPHQVWWWFLATATLVLVADLVLLVLELPMTKTLFWVSTG